MQPAQLHAGLLNQTYLPCSEPPMFLRLESRGWRPPSEGEMQVPRTFCKHVINISSSSWFSIKVKGSEQNTGRDCAPIQEEINFTLLE